MPLFFLYGNRAFLPTSSITESSSQLHAPLYLLQNKAKELWAKQKMDIAHLQLQIKIFD